MITQGDGNLDLAAVAADAALLDLLGARAEVPADDAIASLLAAFADEVDEGLAALLQSAAQPEGAARPVPAGAPAVSAVPALPAGPIRRSHGLRAATIALVVGATLSVSGVAAAVTGDPFAPYRGFVSAVTGGDDEPAAHAARMAWLQRQLGGTRAKVAQGDLAGAAADLAQMRSRLAATGDLSHGQRTALEARISALDAALARAQARVEDDKKQHGTPGSGPGVTTGPQGTADPRSSKAPEPRSSKTPEPRSSKTPEPQNTKKATPPDSAPPEPQHTKKTTAQHTKKATPRVSTTAVPTDGEQPSSADPPGSAKAERPAH